MIISYLKYKKCEQNNEEIKITNKNGKTLNNNEIVEINYKN